VSAGSDWSHTRERSNRLALRCMSWIAVTGGRRLARAVLIPITLYFVLFAPVARKQSRRYLGRVFGRPARWHEVARHFHRFAATVLDRVYFLRDTPGCFEMRLSGVDALQATLARGQGALLIGAHFGSFEAMAAAGRQQAGLRIAMVMYPDNARMINAALEAIAPGFELRIIALGQRGSTLAIRDWLDQGGLAGLLADRVLPGSAPRSSRIHVPFLGVDAAFSDGSFRLAQVLRRPVFLMAGLYNGGRSYDVRLEPLADFSVPAGDGAQREQQLQAAVRAYAARLESLCRESPYNWFNFHDFWSEDVSRPMAVRAGADEPGPVGPGSGAH
jgi:predicted LPLAT superfamily acyltransferase